MKYCSYNKKYTSLRRHYPDQVLKVIAFKGRNIVVVSSQPDLSSPPSKNQCILNLDKSQEVLILLLLCKIRGIIISKVILWR